MPVESVVEMERPANTIRLMIVGKPVDVEFRREEMADRKIAEHIILEASRRSAQPIIDSLNHLNAPYEDLTHLVRGAVITQLSVQQIGEFAGEPYVSHLYTLDLKSDEV